MIIGAVLSERYVVEEIVGTGGMAEVYRAWDRKKERLVALKVLRPEYQSDDEFVRRFSREAEAASKMSHENIVNMYDVGIDGDTRYIVMEFIDGVTLKDMIREMGKLSPDAVARMGIRILAAVDHAHRNGIVHRDIKPQNILVNREGKVKVADFGIARLKTKQTTRVTDAASSALGSVHYLSPEQASGEVADEKSDLYSVGVVFYEMLTGQVPFDGDTAVSIALKHVSEEPKSMRSIDPEIPKAIDEVVLRSLRKNPDERYQTAAEMAVDLRKAVSHPAGGFVKKMRVKTGGKRKEPAKTDSQAFDQRIKRTKIKRRLTYAFIGAVSALLISLIALGLWFFTHGAVPDVRGMSMASAYEALSKDFAVAFRSEYNDSVSEGLVISQYPNAGSRVLSDTEVLVTVSLGASHVTIDNYIGISGDEALKRLSDIGIDDVTVEYVLDAAPAGTVVNQVPESGEVDRNVNVVIMVSGQSVSAPTLTGYTLDNAREYIESLGLTVGDISEAYSADAAGGTVIAQSVAPNSMIISGSSINLTIAQSQNELYYPPSDLRIVVPLDGIRVLVTVSAPSGTTYDAFDSTLDMGTHAVPLSSSEMGEHTVIIYMNGTQVEQLTLAFE